MRGDEVMIFTGYAEETNYIERTYLPYQMVRTDSSTTSAIPTV